MPVRRRPGCERGANRSVPRRLPAAGVTCRWPLASGRRAGRSRSGRTADGPSPRAFTMLAGSWGVRHGCGWIPGLSRPRLPALLALGARRPGARPPGARPPMPGHGRPTEVHLRQVEIVGFARERNPVRGVLTTHGKGVAMVELEIVAGRAPSALLVDEATTASVPLVHGPADGGRDVARGGLRLGLREVLAGGLRETEAAGLEPFELLGDGVFDDGGEVGAGDGGAQEGLEPLELVAQPGAGGELDAVAPGGERLDARRGSRGRVRHRTAPTPSGRSSALDSVASS